MPAILSIKIAETQTATPKAAVVASRPSSAVSMSKNQTTPQNEPISQCAGTANVISALPSSVQPVSFLMGHSNATPGAEESPR
jgi:hypothetical protein